MRELWRTSGIHPTHDPISQSIVIRMHAIEVVGSGILNDVAGLMHPRDLALVDAAWSDIAEADSAMMDAGTESQLAGVLELMSQGQSTGPVGIPRTVTLYTGLMLLSELHYQLDLVNTFMQLRVGWDPWVLMSSSTRAPWQPREFDSGEDTNHTTLVVLNTNSSIADDRRDVCLRYERVVYMEVVEPAVSLATHARQPSATALSGDRCWSRSRRVDLTWLILNCAGSPDPNTVDYTWPHDMVPTTLVVSSTTPSFGDLMESYYSSQHHTKKYLVYTCTHYQECGGNGDRLNGIINSFLLSVLLGRKFLIISNSPLPLSSVFHPANPELVDWRGRLGSAIPDHLHYHDRRQAFVDDVLTGDLFDKYESTADDSPQYVSISTNQFLPDCMLMHPSFPIPELSQVPFLYSHVFRFLFAPTDWLLAGVSRVLASADMKSNQQYIAIHVRVGAGAGQTWEDPHRHSLNQLGDFFSCARRISTDLRLDGALWIVLSDVGADVMEQSITGLGLTDTDIQRIRLYRGPITHIDRTRDIDSQVFQEGFQTAWASWWIMADRAAALVTSRSWFSETAAMAGRLPANRVRFFDYCVKIDYS